MNRSPHPRDLRASDADRERVVAALADAVADGRLTLDEHAERVHQAYVARTLGELAGLTQDLLAPSEQPLRLDEPRSVTTFFGTARREGRWIVPDRFAVTAVGGQVVLDLREALLLSLHTVINATLIGATLHVLVPEGVNVAVTNARAGAGLGARSGASPIMRPDTATPSGPVTRPGGVTRSGAGWTERSGPVPAPGSPLIEVRTVTVAGRVKVQTPRRQGRWRARFGRRPGRTR